MKKLSANEVAWVCLLEVLKKGHSLGCWLAPIPEEEKQAMIERAKEYLSKRRSK